VRLQVAPPTLVQAFCVPNQLPEVIQGVEFKGRIKQLEKSRLIRLSSTFEYISAENAEQWETTKI